MDDHIMVVHKPGGIATNGNRYKTVENALADANKGLNLVDALPRPVAVHRIDVPTKGLLVLARTKTALIQMGRDFEEGKVEKEYVAVVHGKIEKEGEVNTHVAGKRAITSYIRLDFSPSRVYGHLSLVRLIPHTGRTHQLRQHMDSIGHLIVGDKEYQRDRKTVLGKGLFLCARALDFSHPVTGTRCQI